VADLVLRRPTTADVPALSLLGVAAFVHKFGDLYRPEDLLPFLAETHSEAALAMAIADPLTRYQVAERGACCSAGPSSASTALSQIIPAARGPWS